MTPEKFQQLEQAVESLVSEIKTLSDQVEELENQLTETARESGPFVSGTPTANGYVSLTIRGVRRNFMTT